MGRLLVVLVTLVMAGRSQVIEFYSNGLKYQTLTKSGVTVMYAEMPLQLHGYAVIQLAVINGSTETHMVKPVGISYELADGRTINALSEERVISELQQHGGRNDVIKLVTAYERAISGAERIRSNNGYEQRRQQALVFGGPAGLKAAAAASALALVKTRLRPKDSTDGVVFFPNEGKPLGPGVLRVHVDNEVFEFRAEQGT
jgi:hypothetical protein